MVLHLAQSAPIADGPVPRIDLHLVHMNPSMHRVGVGPRSALICPNRGPKPGASRCILHWRRATREACENAIQPTSMASTDHKFLGEGLTYDDVLLVPNYSEVPQWTQLHAVLPKHPTESPIVSAAMDTVTESRMAIAAARNGGTWRGAQKHDIAAQANEVRKVKRSEAA